MYPSRRQILKFIAAAPLTLTFGFAGEALLRFAKPSMKPFGLFDPADMPTGTGREVFQLSDFQEPWTCIPFIFDLKLKEFNPEQQVIREIPAFVIRLQGQEIVAYSRSCPKACCGFLNYVPKPRHYHCGCAPISQRCCCAPNVDNPVLICPCCNSSFDLAHDACIICGPAPRRPFKFEMERQGDRIAVVNLELACIS